MPAVRKRVHPIDLTRTTRYPIAVRANKTLIEMMGSPLEKPGAVPFFRSLPRTLKAKDLRDFIVHAQDARKRGYPFHLLLGAHTIKVGLSPIIIDLMKRGIVSGLSFSGAGLVHDLELAYFGGTSEDVQAGLNDGSFGMAQETGDLFAEVARFADSEELGLGEAGGHLIEKDRAPYRRLSVFASAYRFGVPVTVHVGIGTDIVSQHPVFDAAKVATASHRDFRTLASICADLDRGGVVANVGSAVILPEVLLKALTVARNINGYKGRLTTANFDMIEHYRPLVNVVTRPTQKTGRGYSFIGHHEIMIPLLAWGLKADLKR